MLALIIWCVACSAACVAIVIDTLLPGGPRLPAAAWIIPLAAIVPTWAAAMSVIKGGPFRGPNLRETLTLLRPLPAVVKAGVLALLVAALVNFALFFATGPKGQPEVTDSGYVLNVHGKRTSISRQEYLRAEGAGRRAFAMNGAWFHGWFAAATAAARIRRRRGEHTEERADRWPFSSDRIGDLPRL